MGKDPKNEVSDYEADKDLLMHDVIDKCAKFMKKHNKDVFSLVVSSCHTMMSIDAAGVVRKGNLLLCDINDANSNDLPAEGETDEGDE